MFKKVISALLALTVFASSICPVYAQPLTKADAEYAVSVSLDKETLKAGDLVVATFSLDKNAGLIGLKFKVHFSEDVLQVYSEKYENTNGVFYDHHAENGDIFKDSDFTGLDCNKADLLSPFVLRWIDPMMSDNTVKTGILCTVTFVVKDDVKPGKYDDIIQMDADFVDSITYLTDKTDSGGSPIAAIKNSGTTYFDRVPSVRVPCAKHTWGEWEVTKPATCTQDGEETKTCSVCGEKKTQVITAKGHSWGEWKVTKPATCTQDGEETKTCSVCGEKETKVITAKGHSWGEWKVTKPATCTQDGKETKTCSVCGETETQVITAKGHDWSEWKVTKPATCTQNGEETRTCSVCGEKETKVITAKGHSWGEWKVTKPATCTQNGEETKTCSVCGETETQVITAKGHDWSEWEVTKPATCTQDGEETRTCSVCGEKETQVITAKGHDWSEWKVVKEPTETESGLEERECKRCGEKQENEIPVDIDGNVQTDPDTDVSIITDEGEVPGNVTLNVEKISSSDSEVRYEITLTDENGNSVQPKSEIYVKIPVPDGWDDVEIFVYYHSENGLYTDMHAFVSAGYIYFTTDHLSEYVITTEKQDTVILGDVNGDGEVGELDSVELARYLANWNVTIDEDAADLDGDGEVGETDSVILARRLAGWNV